jgi:hypothetical protein
MTRKPVIESRVSGNCHDQVIPTIELSQRQLIFKRLFWTENSRDRATRVGIQQANFGLTASDIGDTQPD